MVFNRISQILIVFHVLLSLLGCSSGINFINDNFIFTSDKIRPSIYSVNRESGVRFTTSEGIQLVADVYLPNGVDRAPTILVRIPITDTFSNRIKSRFIAQHWASRGYAVVIQGTRGRDRSGGEFYPMKFERQDGIETLRWLSGQTWYDGQILTWGGSAFGQTQWAVSDQKNPGPKAMAIQIASSKFHEMFYPGGAFSLESALFWTLISRGDGDIDRGVAVKDLVKGVSSLSLIKADDFAIGDTGFYNDWVSKKNDVSYWNQIDGTERNLDLEAPVYLIGGWYDPFLPSQLEDYKKIIENDNIDISESTRLVIGPWMHAAEVNLPGLGEAVPYRKESVFLSTIWFDALLGFNGSLKDIPKVSLYVMGENVWRDEEEWPLERAKYTPFYLSSESGANSISGDGALSLNTPISTRQFDSYLYKPLDPVPTRGGAMLSERAGVYSQEDIENRSDILVYSFPKLKEKLEVTGPIKAILYVSTDVLSTDFTVKLVDVHPDGTAYNLSDGILRRNYSGDLGGPNEIEVELWPTSNVFLEGHQIRIEVSSSNFPRYDRNLNIGGDTSADTSHRIANQRVYHSRDYPSRIILPLIPAKK